MLPDIEEKTIQISEDESPVETSKISSRSTKSVSNVVSSKFSRAKLKNPSTKIYKKDAVLLKIMNEKPSNFK